MRGWYPDAPRAIRVACFALVFAFVSLVAPPASARGTPALERGWSNPRALDLAKEAIVAKKAGDAQLCIEKDHASLLLEDHPYVKLHLASCLAATGKLLDALLEAKESLATALRTGDKDLEQGARQRVLDLLPRIAHIRLLVPSDASGIKVTFDNAPVRPALLDKRIAIDPGEHIVAAERSEKGEKYRYVEQLTLADGEERTLEIVLRPQNLTDSERLCAEAATSADEKIACFTRKSTRPNVRVALEASAYSDSTAVHVFSPSIHASVSSPTAGWSAGGSYLVDVLSAASPDIVSMASPAYRETRHAASLNGGAKLGAVQLDAHGNVSSEPDYLSRSVGGAAAIELNDKLVTPRVGYDFARDRIGIRNTPFTQFSRSLTTHTIEAGVTFVLAADTLLVTGVYLGLERGEQSKLYRYVPFFDPADVPDVRPGAGYDEVNDRRLPIRPRETVPRERDRIAVGARINHRMSMGTLRLEERVYADTWGIEATTTDARYMHDLGDHLRVSPHVRYHLQGGASFYERAYAPLSGSRTTGYVLPAFRTTDREWSPMMALSSGLDTRIALTSDKASVRYAVLLGGEVMYAWYFDSLFLENRTAVYGTVGFEVEL